ncbi:MAG TPA: 30S ribosomal protein S20 [Chthoniobacteraceae bacterium]|jgi:small subunit ribosomal protein S20|nr:30S ribosomal protein S20 [Chthoniobacteraceae bacterium]
MANTRSAAKRARQTVRRTLTNKRALTGLKSQGKKVRSAFAAKDKPAAASAVRELASMADKAAKAGRIHKNKANRQKSRLNKQLAALA